jgi:hypothetical protein
MQVREAKDFLVQRTAEQAQMQGAPLLSQYWRGLRAGCQPSVGRLFDGTEMAVLTISSALPLGPFCNLAINWTDVRNDRPARTGIENEKHRRKQKHN